MQKPNRKVASGGFAGAVSVLLVWGLNSAGIEVPAEAAAALTSVVTFAVAYFVPEKS